MRLIAGFDTPTSGTILLEGSDISLLPPFSRPVNTVFQSYALFPHLTVAGNISFGLEMLGKPKREIDETVDQILQLVQMEELKKREILLNISYAWPIHIMRGYSYLGYKAGDFPVAEKAANEIFSLPMYPGLTFEEQDQVCATLTEILGGIHA